jgi:hypothetical protein
MKENYNISDILQNTSEYIESLQVSGINISFDVLTAIVLFFTMFGYFVSSGKDRKQRRDIEIGKSIENLVKYVDDLNEIKSKIDKRTRYNPSDFAELESLASKIRNYLSYKFSLSLSRWLGQSDVIKALAVIKDLEYLLLNIGIEAQSCEDDPKEIDELVVRITDIKNNILILVGLFLDGNKLLHLKSLNKNSSVFYKLLSDSFYGLTSALSRIYMGVRSRYILFLGFFSPPAILMSFDSNPFNIINLAYGFPLEWQSNVFKMALSILFMYVSIGIYKADKVFDYEMDKHAILGGGIRLIFLLSCVWYYIAGIGIFGSLLSATGMPIVNEVWSIIGILLLLLFIFQWFRKS